MKKQLTLVLTLLLLFCACCLVACEGEPCEEHAFTAWWQTTREATCTEAGERTRVCTQCGEVETEAVAPLGHALAHVDAVPPCETDGIMAHDHCDRCNKDFIDGQEISAENLVVTHAGHQYHVVMGQEPTCTASGTIMHLHCDGCDKNLIRDVEYTAAELTLPEAHEIYFVEAIPASCTWDGIAAHRRCVRCGAITTTEGEATTAEALAIPHGHKFVHSDGEAATCTAYGLRAHDRCSVCSQWFLSGEVVDYEDLILEPTGHTCGPLTRSPGRRPHYHCSTCNKDFNEGYIEIADLALPSGHTFTWHDAVPATCTEDGTVGYYTCSDAACAGIRFDAAYTQLADSTLPASHTLPPYFTWDDYSHFHICTVEDCGYTADITSHDVVEKMCYDPERGAPYISRTCRDCAWISEPDYDVPLGFDVDRPFLIDRHALDAWNVALVYPNDDEIFSLIDLLTDEEQARFAETVERLSAADAVLPATERFTLTSPLLTEEVEITFDRYRTTLDHMTVYQKGYLSTFGFFISGNNSSSTWVALRDDQPGLEFIDRGGFDPDYDFSKGNKTYTIKVKYEGEPYEITFTYVNEPTVNRISVSHEAIVAGSYPEVQLHYTNGNLRSYDADNYEMIEVASGIFDPMTPGVYRDVTFRTRDGYATYGPMTITVQDPDEVTGLGTDALAMPLGADSLSVGIRRRDWSGMYETIEVSTNAIVCSDGFDADTVGTYAVRLLIEGKLFSATICVYDPADVPAIWIFPNVYEVAWLLKQDGTPIPDLTGMYIWVTYADGQEAYLPMTADMLSDEREPDGIYGFYQQVIYRGAESVLHVYPVPERIPNRNAYIGVYMNGSDTYGDIYVEDGKLREGQMVRLCLGDYCWFVPLKENMLYTEAGRPFDLSTATAGRHTVNLVCQGVGRTDLNLNVYTSDEVREEIRVYDGSYTIIAGGEAYVMAQLQQYRFMLERYVVTDHFWEELERRRYTFDELTMGDISHIDFTKVGQVTIPLSLGELTCDLTIHLVPALSLYMGETYLWAGDELTLYEDGYAMLDDGSIMTWTLENEALGLFYLTELSRYGDTWLMKFDAETHTCRSWQAEDLGGDAQELYYESYSAEMKLCIFTADGVYYGDLYSIYSDSYTSYDGAMRVTFAADGKTLTFDGVTYLIDAEAGTLTRKMGGKVVYTYEAKKGEVGDDDREITFRFHDDGVCYMTEAATEGTGEVIIDSYLWRVDEARGIIVFSQMKNEVDAFKIDADENLTFIE